MTLRLPALACLVLPLLGGCASQSPSKPASENATAHNFYREPDDTIDTDASLYGTQPPYGPGSAVPSEVNMR